MTILFAIGIALFVADLLLGLVHFVAQHFRNVGMTPSPLLPVTTALFSLVFLYLVYSIMVMAPQVWLVALLFLLMMFLTVSWQYGALANTVILGKQYLYRLNCCLIPIKYDYDTVSRYAWMSKTHVRRWHKYHHHYFAFSFADGKQGVFRVSKPKDRKAECCKAVMQAHRQARKDALQ